MADTTYVNGVTLTDADWFNDVNRLHYTILQDPSNAAAVVAALLATQVQMETGTSNGVVVSPGRQSFHPGHPKGWILASVAGTTAAGFNVDAPTDSATGQVVINWTTDFSSVSYCVLGQGLIAAGGSSATTYSTHTSGQLVGSVTFTNVRMSDFAPFDPTQWNGLAFGDQA